ncbi:PREDICTED: uncharacterized protein LOC108567817 [Nicrophorus vespilloides]|uniref:Uncharacterized protein LOC108567817 n=1 Tax=Nicrophorus vespilloides TaxID=110193 RepID=A0ABM1NAZ9_NICVS|nr:PREDICTED: uncharacterized protein LOC108567817 [Nicrophorus vespilloides]
MKVVLLLSCLVAFAAAYVPCGNPCSIGGGCQSNCGETYTQGCTSGCQQSPYYAQPIEQYGSNQLFSSLFSGSYGRNQPKPMVNPTPFYDQNAIYGGNTMVPNQYESAVPAYNPIGEQPFMAGGLGGGYSNQFSTYGSAGSAGLDSFASHAGGSIGFDAFAPQTRSSGFNGFAPHTGSSGFDAFASHTGSSGFNAFAPHAGSFGLDSFAPHANFDSTSYTLHPTLADVYKNTRGVKKIKYTKEKPVEKEVTNVEVEEEEEEEDETDD